MDSEEMAAGACEKYRKTDFFFSQSLAVFSSDTVSATGRRCPRILMTPLLPAVGWAWGLQ